MTEKNDGGPAFPVVETHPVHGSRIDMGMTLRDYFAGQALVGLIGHGNSLVSDEYDPTTTMADIVAGHAYFLADAMLKAKSE